MAKIMEQNCQTTDYGLDSEYLSTLYHIYHSGPWTRSYSIHTSSDSKTTLRDKNPSNSSKHKHIRKYKALDNPRYDPRTETAPYYVHLPTILDHYPDFTLHRGGTKDKPVIALLRQPCFSRKWKLEFGDFPAQPATSDCRGGGSLQRGTKAREDGTPKHNGTGRRFRGTDTCSGISLGTWSLWKREKKKGYEQLDDEYDGPVEERLQEERHEFNISEREGTEKKVLITEKVMFLSAKGWSLFPVSQWRNPALYQFAWRGWAFHWQRHRDSQSKRGLSLFVWLPWFAATPMQTKNLHRYRETPSGLCQSTDGEFLLLARFSRRRIKRKVGRLEVLDANIGLLALRCLEKEARVVASGNEEDGTAWGTNLDGDSIVDEGDWLEEKLAALALDDFSDQDTASVNSVSWAIDISSEDAVRLRQRIHDVVVATAMCVIMSERYISIGFTKKFYSLFGDQRPDKMLTGSRTSWTRKFRYD